MKKLFFIYFLSSSLLLPLEHVNEAHLVIEIVQDEVKKIESDSKAEQESPVQQSKCPSGSSTKVKVALISASATVISAVILLIIHFYPN